ncbi:MAG: hypothetical protein H0U18_02190 [Pyrinomonadaceae bacterium]|nr:hypothetical protein [Pyrinomonadaceae bacterium]
MVTILETYELTRNLDGSIPGEFLISHAGRQINPSGAALLDHSRLPFS